MGKTRNKGMGALPPPGTEWQLGKTAATIRFVADAEAAIENGGHEPFEQSALRAEIEKLKNGEYALQDWLTVDEFLKTRHD